MVFAPDTPLGLKKLKKARSLFPDWFAYHHIKKLSKPDWFFNGVVAYKVYPDVSDYNFDYFKGSKSKAAVQAEADAIKPTPIEKPKPRPKHPVQGDWVQLLLEGEPCEDFTFVASLIADHDDYYLILDMYSKELKVIPLPERDHGQRKAFRVIP